MQVIERSGISRDIVAAEIDHQLRDGVEPVQTRMPGARITVPVTGLRIVARGQP
jgi:hypothetical protein